MKDWLHDAMVAQRRRIAVRFGLLATIGSAALTIMAFTHVGKGVPSLGACVLLTTLLGLATGAARARLRGAAQLLVWALILGVPFVIVEPGLSEYPDYSTLGPVIAALLLADTWTFVVACILPIAILAIRAPSLAASPYLDPSVISVHVVLVGGIWFAKSMMMRAARQSVRVRIIEGAAARAGRDIIIWQASPSTPVRDWHFSATIATTLGYAANADELRDPLGKVHPEDKVAVRSALDPVLLGESPQCRFECRLLLARSVDRS
jgi:hypothetical protein